MNKLRLKNKTEIGLELTLDKPEPVDVVLPSQKHMGKEVSSEGLKKKKKKEEKPGEQRDRTACEDTLASDIPGKTSLEIRLVSLLFQILIEFK